MTRWTEIRKQNRLVDQGAHAHLNLKALGLARDELGQKAILMHDLVHKISKRSLRSKHSEVSSADEDEIPVGPAGGNGPVSTNSIRPGTHLAERDCFVGQVVPEVDEGSSANELGDLNTDTYERPPSQAHTSHAVSKVRPYEGFERQRIVGANKHSGSITEGVNPEHRSHTAVIKGTRGHNI